ncbi:MAG: hypothetical protein LUG24_08070 [Clostridiales bacterium]|nr:hypothetical protein [Clostridiales bacterium]
MEQNSIYDILYSFSNRETMERDIREIKGLVTDYFRKKYFNRLNSIISSEINRQKTNPSDDLRLLYAIKPYAKNLGGGVMDNVIEAAAVVKAIDNIRGKLPAENQTVMAAAVNMPSVNPDGVYDVDRECLIKAAAEESVPQTDIIFILALAALFIKF